jgi:hypothetical protein
MKAFQSFLRLLLVAVFFPTFVFAGDFARFEGTYKGEAEVVFKGETQRRDMSATIEDRKAGFLLSWTSVIYRSDGRKTEKTYTISFVPSGRENIYTSAMKTNVFGKEVPLDPLKGEPFVWARLEGDTLSVFSLFIDKVGDYEIQEFHRTLVDAGLELRFVRVHNGEPPQEIKTLLAKE